MSCWAMMHGLPPPPLPSAAHAGAFVPCVDLSFGLRVARNRIPVYNSDPDSNPTFQTQTTLISTRLAPGHRARAATAVIRHSFGALIWYVVQRAHGSARGAFEADLAAKPTEISVVNQISSGTAKSSVLPPKEAV